MKIAVLSDIHGNAIALDYVIEDMKLQNACKCIILGDVVNKGPMPAEVMVKLHELTVIGWIKGNTDAWFEEVDDDWKPSSPKEEENYRYLMYSRDNLSMDTLSFLKELPHSLSIELYKKKILCVHGSPRSNTEGMDASAPEEEIKQAIIDVDKDIILCGHTHCPFIGEIGGKRIFNAGGIGISFDGDSRASYGILVFSENGVEFVNRRVVYPVEQLLNIANERNFLNFDAYANTMLNATR